VSDRVPSERKLRGRMRWYDCLVSVPAVAVLLVYLGQMLELEPAEWRSFWGVLAVFGVLAGLALEGTRVRMHAPVFRYLARRGGEDVSGSELRSAFAAAVAAPRIAHRRLLGVWLAAVVWLAISMSLLGSNGWIAGNRAAALLVVGLAGGLVTSTVIYFLVKAALHDVTGELAGRISDPVERAALVQPLALGTKIQLAVSGTGVALLVFTLTLGDQLARRSHDERASAWQERVVQALATQVAAGQSLEVASSELLPVRRLLPQPTRFELLSRGDSDPGASRLLGRTAGRESGTARDRDAGELISWARVDAGRVVVARTSRSQVHAALSGARPLEVVAFALAAALLSLVALLFSRDLGRGLSALAAEAERMAGGDLRRGAAVESEDELGDLGRAFERMGGALRATVGRVAEAADRVESAASGIARVSGGISAASADQVRRIQQANELMLRMNGQVNEISSSAQALNVSVEESSSSILELGAAGDELNDTASVLSTKVDEVSSSIEQMVRSVKQVSSTSLELSDAASDTASSMEEMASSMRAVDVTAEATAELSGAVVEAAEGGQAKVSQTIDGMQAIREATDAAEGVIRGLGDRAKEIGAILDVIDDVADETNLLALNAAIIAAQAGEHGRAFSVVAEEIKELADRVLVSTKEIGGLIGAVQDESSNAIHAIEEGSRSVATGVDRSAEAGTSLEEITRNARESGSRIGQIVSAVREQTSAAAHVAELMERVRNGVEQIGAAGAEQDRGNEVVFRSSVTMSEVAQQVRRTTEEQSRGFARIRESVEGVREAVEDINGSLQQQSSACSQVAEFLEQVYERTQSNEESARRMGDSMQGLVREAEALREDVAKFQI